MHHFKVLIKLFLHFFGIIFKSFNITIENWYMFTNNFTILIEYKKRLQWVYMNMSSRSITDLYCCKVPLDTVPESFDYFINSLIWKFTGSWWYNFMCGLVHIAHLRLLTSTSLSGCKFIGKNDPRNRWTLIPY